MSIKKNLDDVVYENICLQFVGGKYVAGGRLDPAELADLFQVSKTPVIQALKRMVSEHIAEVTRGGKYYIPQVSGEIVDEICAARLLFEEEALNTLCTTITEDQLIVLNHLVERCGQYFDTGKYNEYFIEDMKLHQKFVEFAGNTVLEDLFSVLMNRYMVVQSTSGINLAHSPAAKEEHFALVDALSRHAKKEVRQLIRKHVMQLQTRMKNSNP